MLDLRGPEVAAGGARPPSTAPVVRQPGRDRGSSGRWIGLPVGVEDQRERAGPLAEDEAVRVVVVRSIGPLARASDLICAIRASSWAVPALASEPAAAR